MSRRKSRVTPTGVLDKPDTRVEFSAKGRIEGIDTSRSCCSTARARPRHRLVARRHRYPRWQSASTRPAFLQRVPAWPSNETGQATSDQTIEGQLNLSIADLRPFSGFAGHPLAGAVELAADAVRQGAAGFEATLHGSTKELRTGIAVGFVTRRPWPRRGDAVRLSSLRRPRQRRPWTISLSPARQ